MVKNCGATKANLKKLTALLALLLISAADLPALTDTEMKSFLDGLPAKTDMSQAHVSLIDMRDPGNPVRAGYRDTEIVPTASIIKLTLISGAYRAVYEDGLSFNKEITIRKENYTGTWTPGNDPYPQLRPGAVWKLKDLVEVMIRRSDNVATNTLIDELRRERVTEFMHGAGCAKTFLRHKLSSGTDVSDPDATGYNAMPAYDAATTLYLIASGKMVNKEASAAMYETLSHQMDRDLIAAALPPGVIYAGKTGELSAARNDAAIVSGPGRSYVLVIYTSLPDAKAKPVIRAITREVDTFLSK